jgi:hypothetical protein
MLVANRDPFHAGADDVPSAPGGIPRLARAMSVLQIAGTLLAIPVGLGSAYSMYRANFSVDATCQSLRANIISIIDKKIDAGTRRMLVRRDVESFEKSCGGFDPDAEAAFKTILAADKAPAAAAAKARADAPPKVAAHKADPHPALAAKTPAANVAAVAAEAEPVRTEAAVPDDKWLDAVRNALVTSEPEPVTPVSVKTNEATPVAQPAPSEIHVAKQTAAPVAIVSPAAPPMTLAPDLPPGTSIAAPSAASANPDHPVPPASIPEVTSSVAKNDASAEPSSRFGWIAHIPLLGHALAR